MPEEEELDEDDEDIEDEEEEIEEEEEPKPIRKKLKPVKKAEPKSEESEVLVKHVLVSQTEMINILYNQQQEIMKYLAELHNFLKSKLEEE